MLIYRVMENDGCYNECEPYRMGGMTSLPSNGNYVKGLNSFDKLISSSLLCIF